MTSQPVPSQRQTLSFLRDLLYSRGLSPKSKMGQNFLIDLNLLDLIVDTAELTKEDAVLEVGTGTGSLTGRLCDRAGTVVSIELAPDFYKMASEMLAGRTNLSLLLGDVLARKNEMNPEVLAEWENRRASAGCTRKKLVANLPYVVATPVIANLLIADPNIERMVVMVQWEMAERLTAVPCTKEYSALAVLANSLAEVKIVRRLAPTVFWPQPKVDSAIVLIRPDAIKRGLIADVARFRVFLRDLYTHRRKTLRQSLVGWPSGRKDKKEVDAKLVEIGIDGTTRAEMLGLDQHRQLWHAFDAEGAI
jgi:16S rRNA (adenine1518-N6/adenine1519-N6)-dimethyltransferase